MTDRPRFVVDPSGNVRDVGGQRQLRSAPPSVSRPGAETPGRTWRVYTRPPVVRKTRKPSGVVFIPIGLIISIIVFIVRMCGAVTAGDGYTYSYSSSSPRSSYPRSSSSPRSSSFSEVEISVVDDGISSYIRGDYDTAMMYFNMALSADPRSAEAYNGRGLVYEAQGDYAAAIEDFGKVIELRPSWPGGYSNRGATYYALGKYGAAIADLERAIELDGRFAKAHYNLGLVHFAIGQFTVAIGDFDRAIEFTSEAAYTRLDDATPGPGNEMLERMEAEWALMQTDADLALAYAYRGMAYLSIDQLTQAADDLEKALDLGLDPIDQVWVEAALRSIRQDDPFRRES
jgi:tetratricopeptide (TPR) repeat protein